jgi:hypothetical protein
LISGREGDALAQLESAKEKLPNNPTIDTWLKKLKRAKATAER